MADDAKPDVDGFFLGPLRELCNQIGREIYERVAKRDPLPGAKVGFVLLMNDMNGKGVVWASSVGGRAEVASYLRQVLDKIEAGPAGPEPGRIIVQ